MTNQAYELVLYAIRIGDVKFASEAAKVLAHCAFLIVPDLREQAAISETDLLADALGTAFDLIAVRAGDDRWKLQDEEKKKLASAWLPVFRYLDGSAK